MIRKIGFDVTLTGARIWAFVMAAALALPMISYAPPAAAKKLSWNEIQECIYLPYEMQQAKKVPAYGKQNNHLPKMTKHYENRCKGKGNVNKRDFEVVCSIPSNKQTVFCSYLRNQFAGR